MENSPSTVATAESFFDGSTLQLIGYKILTLLLCVVTLGLAFPWTLCMLQGWETRHTVIRGRRLKFDGTGGQLFGRFLLWVLLTVVTLGIYGFFLGLNVKKWTVKHTLYADSPRNWESEFTGGIGGYIGIHFLALLLTVLTLGLGAPWAKAMLLRWEAGHTRIGGACLSFDGTGGQLLGKYLLLIILTPLTLGIYALCFPVSYAKWLVKHTDSPGRPSPGQERSESGGEPGEVQPESTPASGGGKILPVLFCVLGAAALFFLAPILLNRLRYIIYRIPLAHNIPVVDYWLHSVRVIPASDPPASAAPSSGTDSIQSLDGLWGSYENEGGELYYILRYFDSDGTYAKRAKYCDFLSYEPGENAYDQWGSYSLNGDKLTVTIYQTIYPDSSSLDDSEFAEWTYTIQIEGDALTILDGLDSSPVDCAKLPEPQHVPEADYTQSIVGSWGSWHLYTHEYTGEPYLEGTVLTFTADGGYSFWSGECSDPSPSGTVYHDGEYWNVAGGSGTVYDDGGASGTVYYDGEYWNVALGYGHGGDYSLNGDELTTNSYLDSYGDEEASIYTDVDIIKIEGDMLYFRDVFGEFGGGYERGKPGTFPED